MQNFFQKFNKISLFLIVFFVTGLLCVDYVYAQGCCMGGAGCESAIREVECMTIAGCEWNPLCTPSSALNEFVGLLIRLMEWSPFVASIMAGLVLLVGAFKYITSGDDRKKLEQARMTIFYALLGLFMSASLYLIIRLVVAVIPGLSRYAHLG